MKIYQAVKRLFSKSAREKNWLRTSHNHDTVVKIDGVNIQVGKYTYGVGNIQLAHHQNSPPLKIGRFCAIAGNVKIFTGAYHRSDWITTYPFGMQHQDTFGATIPPGFPHSKGGVTIGNDVWIGNSATIMSGISVGDGAIIAANSHVIKDVAPYEIVGGNPAGHIKYRFSPPVVEDLLRIQWWNLEEDVIKKIHQHLTVIANPANLDSLELIIAKAQS